MRLFCVLLMLATNRLAVADVIRRPWPFAPSDRPCPVANLVYAPQRPGTPLAYLHGGIDIRKPAGTPVLAVARGTVLVYREGPYDNLVLTEADRSQWEYRHLAPGSVPPVIRAASVDGTAIRAGDVIGTVGRWSADYAHLHLNRRGRTGRILDPLDHLIAHVDRLPPVIRGVHLLPDKTLHPIAPGPDGVVTVRGRIDVVVVADDRMDGEPWRHPPRSVAARLRAGGWSLDARPFAGGLPRPASRPVPRYPRGPMRAWYLMQGPLATRNRVPYRRAQRFSVVLTHWDDGPAPGGAWDTSTVADGAHVLDVVVRDAAGHEARTSLSLRVANRRPR